MSLRALVSGPPWQFAQTTIVFFDMGWSHLLEKSVIVHALERVSDFEAAAERIEFRWVVQVC